jgi:hypothetical protein
VDQATLVFILLGLLGAPPSDGAGGEPQERHPRQSLAAPAQTQPRSDACLARDDGPCAETPHPASAE